MSYNQQAGPITDVNASLRPAMIVVIGASAGGNEAVRQLFNAIPPDSGIAFLYIQHSATNGGSKPDGVLSKEATVKMVQVKRSVRITSDSVYLCPADRDITVHDGELKVSPRHPRSGRQFPIDRLFVSVADTYGKNAVGILLSGNSPDGTAGLAAIKASGGTTFAQDETARHKVTPKSAIAKGIVDYILSPEKIGEELNRITTSRKFHTPGLTGAEPQIVPAGDGTRNDTGLVLSEPAEKIESFFQHRESMTYLEEAILPRILEIKGGYDPIRIWVPACSTGEKAYSIAIILAELLIEKLASTRIQIFATDLSEQMLAKARSGTYSRAEVAGVSPARLQRFFTKTGDGFQINKLVRDLCIFAHHDIFKDPPFCRIDLIDSSNLLCCLEDFPGEKALAIFHYAINPYGYLTLGPSEEMRGSQGLFTHAHEKFKVYTKVSTTFPHDLLEMNYGFGSPRHREHAERSPEQSERSLKQEVDTILLKEYTSPSVIINENWEVLQFRGSTRLFLEPGASKASLNLLKMVRPDLESVLKKVVLRVVRSKEKCQEDAISMKLSPGTVDISVEVIPLQDGPAGQLLLVIFREIISTIIPASRATDIKDKTIRELENELLTARKEMRSLKELQKEVNEELQAANEELHSANEELRSANEELMASRGEIADIHDKLITAQKIISEMKKWVNGIAECAPVFRRVI